MRYIMPCLLFLANDEVISMLALVIVMVIFLLDCWKSHEEVRNA